MLSGLADASVSCRIPEDHLTGDLTMRNLWQLILAASAGILLASCTNAASDAPGRTPPAPVVIKADTGATCGGIAALQCGAETDYCALPAKACREIADASGTCTPRPEVCTMDYTPVCGCDDKTYSNACQAAASGISVAYDGECTV